MEKGWIILYEDGTHLLESECDWKEAKKVGIKTLRLKWHNKYWEVSGKKGYIQFKTCSIDMNGSNGILHSRCIGYYDEEGNKIIYRVDEQTGKMKIEVINGGKS